MMESCYDYLKENYAAAAEKISAAAKKSGRSAEDITLVSVTKTVPQEIIAQAIKLGAYDIGENKVQEMLSKEEYLSAYPHKTHIIGHLQTNKVKYLPGKVAMIQSVDSEKLADEIEKVFGAKDMCCDVLAEVNIGGEESKSGVSPEKLEQLCIYLQEKPHIRLKGLMCIPPICENDLVRNYFAEMYKLFVDIREKKLDNRNINILSMGMSADYEAAITEGANMVRIGTSLFGKRNYNI